MPRDLKNSWISKYFVISTQHNVDNGDNVDNVANVDSVDNVVHVDNVANITNVDNVDNVDNVLSTSGGYNCYLGNAQMASVTLSMVLP